MNNSRRINKEPSVALRAFPLRGTHPVAWQSQFHGCAGDRRAGIQGSALC